MTLRDRDQVPQPVCPDRNTRRRCR